jgi:hypothetical protein
VRDRVTGSVAVEDDDRDERAVEFGSPPSLLTAIDLRPANGPTLVIDRTSAGTVGPDSIGPGDRG